MERHFKKGKRNFLGRKQTALTRVRSAQPFGIAANFISVNGSRSSHVPSVANGAKYAYAFEPNRCPLGRSREAISLYQIRIAAPYDPHHSLSHRHHRIPQLLLINLNAEAGSDRHSEAAVFAARRILGKLHVDVAIEIR